MDDVRPCPLPSSFSLKGPEEHSSFDLRKHLAMHTRLWKICSELFDGSSSVLGNSRSSLFLSLLPLPASWLIFASSSFYKAGTICCLRSCLPPSSEADLGRDDATRATRCPSLSRPPSSSKENTSNKLGNGNDACIGRTSLSNLAEGEA